MRFQIQRGVIVIPKSVTPARIKSNYELFDFVLDDEDMAALFRINRDLRIVQLTWDGLPNHKDFPF